jgi:hypothetical protein
MPFTGNYNITALHTIGQAHQAGHHVEPGLNPRPEGRQATSQPSGGPGARQGIDINTELVPVVLSQGDEAPAEFDDVVRGGPLLWTEEGGGIPEGSGHVAGHHQIAGAQAAPGHDGIHGAEPTVGGG